MDSLLSTYASSDDEEEEEAQPPPKPSSSSLVINGGQGASKAAIKPSSIFSNLTLPKPRNSSTDLSSSLPNPKRVVQFRPPINPFSVKSGELDDDDEEEDRERERRRQRDAEASSRGSSVKSFLSAIPAPKNSVSLGALPSAGSGRRAIVVDTEALQSNSAAPKEDSDSAASSNSAGNHKPEANWNSENYAQFYPGDLESGSDNPSAANYSYHESYSSGFSEGGGSSTGGYAGYGSYGVESSSIPATETLSAMEMAMKGSGKRGRSEIPKNIIEVKQEELMKNRPREDQVKSTGIAFGPSYQPTSTKGKPTKLHKRKHQIGSLYFDMKSKESELAERRSRGFLTKAETHAKYGW